MCSGRCITNTCDGVNDCGDWRDEFNCSKGTYRFVIEITIQKISY